MRRRNEARLKASAGQAGSQGVRKARESPRKAAQACQSPRSGGRSQMRGPSSRGAGGCRLKRRGNCRRWAADPRADARLTGKARTDPVEMLDSADLAERGEGRSRRGDPPGDAHHRLVVDRLDAGDDVGDVEELVIDQEMLGELLAARRRTLERHQYAGLELRPRPLELGHAQPVADPPDLLAHRRDELDDLLRSGAGIDSEDAAVATAVP